MIRRLATLPFACALLVTSAVALARAPVVPPTASELRAIVETLTAPEMDGRRAGTPGGERATERLATWLGAVGPRPPRDSGTVLQSFRVAPGRRLGPGSALEIGGRAAPPRVGLTPRRGSLPRPTHAPRSATARMRTCAGVGPRGGQKPRVGAVVSGARLRAATAAAARPAGVPADLRGTPYSPSDRARFYSAGAPVLFFHTGGHEDY